MSRFTERCRCTATFDIETDDPKLLESAYGLWGDRHETCMVRRVNRPDLEDAVLKLALSDLSLREIAEQVGLNHPQSVKHILAKHGVKR